MSPIDVSTHNCPGKGCQCRNTATVYYWATSHLAEEGSRPGVLATYCEHAENTHLQGGWLLCQGCGLRYRLCPTCERRDPYHEMGCTDPLVFEDPS